MQKVSWKSFSLTILRNHQTTKVHQKWFSSSVNFFEKVSPAMTMFNTYKDPDRDTLNISRFLTELERTGIRRSDPRLADFMNQVQLQHELLGEYGTTMENVNIDEKTFEKMIEPNFAFLHQISTKDLVIPDFKAFCDDVRTIFDKCRDNYAGRVASYIPQLAKSSPDTWACSICTVDGQRFSLGNIKKRFSLQSCSKPFTYAICMNELGSEVVHKYVGQEPSGRNFNEICLDSQNKPHNPMLNSGAIMISALSLGLLKPELSLADKFDYLQRYLRRVSGFEYIGFNNAVFLSERQTADRNFAMAYLMKEQGIFPPQFNLQECMDLYFMFCSLEVDTEALAVMGGTLANGGICPITGEQVLESVCVRNVLSLMYSCGMYNHSGQFAFSVGLPAKSGVSGALVLVIPNTMSIALWSPPLDSKGNTVRGLQFCHALVDNYNFHRFDNLRHSPKKMDPRLQKHEQKRGSIVNMIFAATYGDISALKRHFLQGLDMNGSDYDGRTALHVAAAEGHLHCVKFLVEVAKVDLSPLDRWGFTPLEEARRFGKSDVFAYLKPLTTNEPPQNPEIKEIVNPTEPS